MQLVLSKDEISVLDGAAFMAATLAVEHNCVPSELSTACLCVFAMVEHAQARPCALRQVVFSSQQWLAVEGMLHALIRLCHEKPTVLELSSEQERKIVQAAIEELFISFKFGRLAQRNGAAQA
jgi:hypothetical protein